MRAPATNLAIALLMAFVLGCSNEPDCPAGQLRCDGDCVDLHRERDHCGGCGQACAEGEYCSAGVCSRWCAENETDCSGTCADLRLDADNCGSCGNACQSSARCVEGRCESECASGQISCEGACVWPETDARHCGGCGRTCAAEQVCFRGACKSGCDEGLTVCGAACVDVANDVRHCGRCDQTCPTGPNATASCASGECQLVCLSGWNDCDASIGCESRSSEDPVNCGACGTVCADRANGTGACIQSACELACASLWGDCDLDLENGCESSLAEDEANCGACGATCPPIAHAVQSCVAGRCESTCDGGWGDCDVEINNGCESSLLDDPSHCGGCAQRCGTLQICRNGSCQTDGKLVFVTSQRFTGDLGGLSGADSTCQWLASRAGFSGSFRAWLSATQGSPSTRFTRSTGAYRLVDGTIVAVGWAELTGGTLRHAIDRTELNAAPTVDASGCDGGAGVWSNTLSTGVAATDDDSQNCADWTGSGSSVVLGATHRTDSGWSHQCAVSGALACGGQRAFYCFEQ